jgi:hypothetical protein
MTNLTIASCLVLLAGACSGAVREGADPQAGPPAGEAVQSATSVPSTEPAGAATASPAAPGEADVQQAQPDSEQSFWQERPGSYTDLEPCSPAPLVPIEVLTQQWRCSAGDQPACDQLATRFEADLAPYRSPQDGSLRIPEERLDADFIQVFDACGGPGGGWAGCSYLDWDEDTNAIRFYTPGALFERYLPKTAGSTTVAANEPVREAAAAYCAVVAASAAGDVATARSRYGPSLECIGDAASPAAESAEQLRDSLAQRVVPYPLDEPSGPLAIHALVALHATDDEVILAAYLYPADNDEAFGLEPYAVVLRRGDSGWQVTAEGWSESHGCLSLPGPS